MALGRTAPVPGSTHEILTPPSFSFPGDLERFWLGHANKTVTDDYSRPKKDVTFRKEVPEKGALALRSRLKAAMLHPMHPRSRPTFSSVCGLGD